MHKTLQKTRIMTGKIYTFFHPSKNNFSIINKKLLDMDKRLKNLEHVNRMFSFRKTIGNDILQEKKIVLPDQIISDKPIIVSLTTTPRRISIVKYAIYSILNQSIPPNKVILYLSSQEFLTTDKSLLELKKYNFPNFYIKFVSENIRSFKKLMYTYKEFSDSYIITIDDDCIYDFNTIKRLISNICSKNCIVSTGVQTIYMKDNKIEIDRRIKNDGSMSFLNIQIGSRAVLYQPRSLNLNIFNDKDVREKFLNSDDIFFWYCAVKNRSKIKACKFNTSDVFPNYKQFFTYPEIEYFSTDTLYSENKILDIEVINNIINRDRSLALLLRKEL